MKNIKIGELYELLFYMDKSHSITQLAEKLFISQSKASKLVSKYEDKLNIKLFNKNKQVILSKEGKEVLEKIRRPYLEISSILDSEKSKVMVDEGLIGILDERLYTNYEIQYVNNKDLIEAYNKGQTSKIICSKEFEADIKHHKKEFVVSRNIYYVKMIDNEENKLYANDDFCAITRKLQFENIRIDCYLQQSIAVCKAIKQKKGCGYLFEFDSFKNEEAQIKKTDMQIEYYKYVW